MKHVIEKHSSDRVIFLLHGTGGDASSLLDIGRMIDPDATLIGLEGTVLEQGMRRYFKRYPDGKFDLTSLKEETSNLQEEIQKLRKDYELIDSHVSLLGYSNGANIAINLFKEFETSYEMALLFHPALGRGDVPFLTQKGLTMLMTSGNNDPFITEEEFRQLVSKAQSSGIEVKTLVHKNGHQLILDEIKLARELYNQKFSIGK